MVLLKDILKKPRTLEEVVFGNEEETGKKQIAQLIRELKDILSRIPAGPKGDMPTKEELLNLIKPLIPKPEKGEPGEPGEPGSAPTKQELTALIRSLIPKVKDGEPGHTPTQEELLTLIELAFNQMDFNGKIKTVELDIEKKIEELEKKIAELLEEKLGGVNAPSSKPMTVVTRRTKLVGFEILETVSGDVDGSNKVFGFTKKPTLIMSGLALLREDKGWTWNDANKQATLTYAPQTETDIYGLK